MDLILAIQQLRDSFVTTKDSLIQKHPTWDKVKDARLTLLSKCVNVLNSTQLGMVHIQFNLTQRQWWTSISKSPIADADIQIYLNEFDMFIKLGFLQFLFASIESSLRLIVKAIDPTACSGGTAEFKSIYSFLLKRLTLQKYEALLDLLRCIRNTIHNNGVYFHRSGNNKTVVHNGITYTFEIGKSVDFVNWQFLFDLLPELRQMIIEVVESNEVSSIDTIVDPFAK
jgi:hypothetical protein